MDGDRFDRWVRVLGSGRSRRHVVKGAVAALAAGVFGGAVKPDDAEAASRRCEGQPNGAPCGRCGVCQGEVCTPGPCRNKCDVCDATQFVCKPADCGGCGNCDPSTGKCAPVNGLCGVCEKCDAETFECYAPADPMTCGSCGLCNQGKCDKIASVCEESCGKCKKQGSGKRAVYNCGDNKCQEDQRCCPGNKCIPKNDCCKGYKKCPDGKCCPDAQTCTSTGCCDTANSSDKICGTGAKSICCSGLKKCCETGDTPHCCDADADCCGDTCCAEGQACCDGQCKTPEECCEDCGPCEKCDTSELPNVTCTIDPDKEGTACSETGCGSRCKNGDCDPILKGETCLNGKTCCGLICCDGECQANGTCCDEGSFFAAEANLCCPYGPPCGLPGSEVCCAENETCAPGSQLPVPECCPAARTCGQEGSKTCCGEGQSCCGTICCDNAALCCPDQNNGIGACYEQAAARTCCGVSGACGVGALTCCLSTVVPDGWQCFPDACPEGFYPQP